MRLLLIPTAALVCCLSTGCANDTSRARESARLFLSAANRGDVIEAQKLVTLAARPNVATMFKDSKTGGNSFTLGEAKVTDETAEVSVTLTGSDSKPTLGKVLLRREEKEWRVWALRFQTESGTELTLDFEHPERVIGEALGAAFGELTKKLEHASKDAEKSGRAFGEALGGFMKGFSEGVEKSVPTSKPPGTGN